MMAGRRGSEMARRQDGKVARRQQYTGSRCLAALLSRCLAVSLLLIAAPAAAQDNRPQLADIELGFQNRFKTGTWTPLRVGLTGGKEPFEGVLVVEVPDADGEATRNYPLPVLLEPGQTARFSTLIKPGQDPLSMQLLLYTGGARSGGLPAGRLRRRISVDFTDPEFQDRFQAIHHTDDLFLVWGKASLSSALLGQTNAALQHAHWVATIDSPAMLPTRWHGYDGVDAVVVATADVDDLALLEDTRMAALAEWVRRGGRLVVSVAAQWDQVRNHPLVELLPASLSAEAPVMLREFQGLLEFSNNSKEGLLPPGAIEGVPVARLLDVHGRVLADEGRVPLVVRGSYGFGEVTLVTMDLDRAPFDRWKGRPDFWRSLLELPALTDDSGNQAASGQIGFMAITDLASQLRHCLEKFEGVQMVSFGWVAFFILLYIVLIGPGDYFFLKKMWKLEMTWITFPAMVLVVSVAAYFTAYVLKGRDLRVNQIEVIDVDGSSALVRGTTWFTLFSPRIDTYNLEVEPALGRPIPGEPGPLLAWMGLPEDSLRGMYRPSGTGLFRRDYRFGLDAQSLHGVPIQVWSTKGFTARWKRNVPGLIEIGGEGRLTSTAPGELQGTLAHHLDRPLEDCVLAFETRAYLLGDLSPGQQVAVGASTTQRLRDALQEVRRTTQQVVGHDRDSTDPDDVIPLMMLYEEAAGFSHTGLTNRYVPTIDWSGHLKTGHAVLYGKLTEAPEAVTQIRRDGEPLAAKAKVHTYVRFLLSVGSQGAR